MFLFDTDGSVQISLSLRLSSNANLFISRGKTASLVDVESTDQQCRKCMATLLLLGFHRLCFGSAILRMLWFFLTEVVSLPLVDGEMLMDRLRGLERGELPVWMGRDQGARSFHSFVSEGDATSLGSKTFLSEHLLYFIGCGVSPAPRNFT